MRIIILWILLMRMGTEALTLTPLSAPDTLISTTTASVEKERQSATFRLSGTEMASESLVLVETKNESFFPATSVIKTTSSYVVPAVTPVVIPVSVGTVITQSNEPTVIREIISSVLLGTSIDTETVSHLTVLPEMKTISHIELPVISTTTSNLTDEVSVTASLTEITSTTIAPSPTTPIVDEETTSFSTSTSKPTSVVKKASSITDTPKVIRKPSFSPVVAAKRCCKDQHHLDNNECVATANPIPFEPLSNIEMDLEITEYRFSWEIEMLNCSKGFKLQEFNLKGDDVTLKANKTESFLQRKVGDITKTPSAYCIHQKAIGDYSVLVCVPDMQTLCEDATCLPKCCAPDEVMSHLMCKKSTREFSPTYYTIQGDEIPAPKDIKIVPRAPRCPYMTTITFSNMTTDPYYILSTGKLYLRTTAKRLDITQYCIDYYPEAQQEVAVYCEEPPSKVHEWKIFLIPITMIISIVFLIIIVICHLITPHLRNVQGLCFLAYSTVLLMSYFGFYTNFKYTRYMKSGHCVFTAVFNQISLLSAFFWLCVMCFDIWRVIRATVKCVPLSGILENDAQKFILYAAIAFGCPLVIGIFTLIMQYLPPEYSNGLIVPEFGKESCWFANELEQFLYFYLIIALLNGSSLMMLAHILFMLFEAEQGFSCLFRRQSSDRAFNRKHLALFRQRLSLFALMTVCWFAEVLSLKIPPKDIWVVTDILNTLQGVAVFIIFISSKKKRELVKSAVATSFSKVSKRVTKTPSAGEDKDTSGSSDSSRLTDESGKERVVMQTLAEKRRKEEEEVGGIVNNAFEHQDDTDAKKENITEV